MNSWNNFTTLAISPPREVYFIFFRGSSYFVKEYHAKDDDDDGGGKRWKSPRVSEWEVGKKVCQPRRVNRITQEKREYGEKHHGKIFVGSFWIYWLVSMPTDRVTHKTHHLRLSCKHPALNFFPPGHAEWQTIWGKRRREGALTWIQIKFFLGQ